MRNELLPRELRGYCSELLEACNNLTKALEENQERLCTSEDNLDIYKRLHAFFVMETFRKVSEGVEVLCGLDLDSYEDFQAVMHVGMTEKGFTNMLDFEQHLLDGAIASLLSN